MLTLLLTAAAAVNVMHLKELVNEWLEASALLWPHCRVKGVVTNN